MNVLQTIDLKKQYGAEPNITRALDGVNLSVEQGEFVAVVGTSGSVIVRGDELAKKNDEELTIFPAGTSASSSRITIWFPF